MGCWEIGYLDFVFRRGSGYSKFRVLVIDVVYSVRRSDRRLCGLYSVKVCGGRYIYRVGSEVSIGWWFLDYRRDIRVECSVWIGFWRVLGKRGLIIFGFSFSIAGVLSDIRGRFV